jgi:hypothetical protein
MARGGRMVGTSVAPIPHAEKKNIKERNRSGHARTTQSVSYSCIFLPPHLPTSAFEEQRVATAVRRYIPSLPSSDLGGDRKNRGGLARRWPGPGGSANRNLRLGSEAARTWAAGVTEIKGHVPNRRGGRCRRRPRPRSLHHRP